MELRAVYEALSSAPRALPLVIETDSEYVLNIFTKWLEGWRARGWRTSSRKPVANQRAIQMVELLLIERDVTWRHVYGHTGHYLNEIVDLHARTAATAVKEGWPVPVGMPHCMRELKESQEHHER